jgi:hypothetical protein
MVFQSLLATAVSVSGSARPEPVGRGALLHNKESGQGKVFELSSALRTFDGIEGNSVSERRPSLEILRTASTTDSESRRLSRSAATPTKKMTEKKKAQPQGGGEWQDYYDSFCKLVGSDRQDKPVVEAVDAEPDEWRGYLVEAERRYAACLHQPLSIKSNIHMSLTTQASTMRVFPNASYLFVVQML